MFVDMLIRKVFILASAKVELILNFQMNVCFFFVYDTDNCLSEDIFYITSLKIG